MRVICLLHPEDPYTIQTKMENLEILTQKLNTDKTVYTAKLLTSNIGYSIVSKEDGCRVDVKLIRIGDVENIPYTKPKYSENKAIWENIIPGMDIIIEFKPYKVKVWKILYKKDVARDVEFTVIKDEDCTLNIANHNTAFDNNQRIIKVKTKRINSKTYRTSKTKKNVEHFSIDNIK